MRYVPGVIVVLVTAVFVTSCVNAPQVFQGTVITYEVDSKTLHVRNDDNPEQVLTFSLQGAEVGADPLPQDVVRIAYKDEGGRLVATRVMNLTRQKEIGARGSGGH